MANRKEATLTNLLWQVKEVLDKHNVEFWLDCGTLLGAVRNGKFIPWEHDIDFGAWQDNFSDSTKILLCKEFSKRGLGASIYQHHINVRKKEVEETWLDVNFYYLNKDKVIMPRLFPTNAMGRFFSYFLHVLFAPYRCKVDRTKSIKKRFIMNALINISCAIPFILRKWLIQMGMIIYKRYGSKDVSWVIPNKYFTHLSTIRFYGMEFKVPAKSEEYLTYRYGKDWRIPKRDWITGREEMMVQFSIL